MMHPYSLIIALLPVVGALVYRRNAARRREEAKRAEREKEIQGPKAEATNF